MDLCISEKLEEVHMTNQIKKVSNQNLAGKSYEEQSQDRLT